MEREELERQRLESGYWDKTYFLDHDVNLNKARMSQKLAGWNAIFNHQEYFLRDKCDTAMKMIIAAWIVGSGKTIGIPIIAAALNQLYMRARGRSAPRIRKMLVLVKEEALRSQVVKALREECISTGVFKIAPRVYEWNTKQDIRTLSEVYDIVVCCEQKLWFKNDSPRPDLAEELAQFDIVFVDEPHFAPKQVVQLVNAASHAFCFGMTGTPIDSDGVFLENYALMSVYGYEESITHDGSLKWLPDNEDDLDKIVTVIKTKSCEVTEGERRYKLQGPAPDHDLNASPVIAVADEVVNHILKLDQIVENIKIGKIKDNRKAPHRSADDVADIIYDPHAIIVVKDIAIADMVVDHMNRKLSLDPRCSAEKGYRFVKAHSQDSEPLNSDHSWLLAKGNKGRIVPGKSARFLVLVKMGREGLDHPGCATVGAAFTTDSLIEMIQRIFGRQLRSYVYLINGVRHVPYYDLDRPRIITHEAFNNMDIIKRGYNFLIDMPSAFSNIQTLYDISQGEPSEIPDSRGLMFRFKHKLDVLGNVGSSTDSNPLGPWVHQMLNTKFSYDAKLHKKAVEFLTNAIEHPEEAWHDMSVTPPIDPRNIVRYEKTSVHRSPEDIVSFFENHAPGDASYIVTTAFSKPDTDPDYRVRTLADCFVEKWQKSIPDPPLFMNTPLHQILREYAHEAVRVLGPWWSPKMTSKDDPSYAIATNMIKEALGVRYNVKFTDDSEWGEAEPKALLQSTGVKWPIVLRIAKALIAAGHCPAVTEGLYRMEDPKFTASWNPENKRSDKGRNYELPF